MEIRDRSVLITGAASGIGRATALAAAAQGARLVLTDVAAERLAGTVRDVQAAGGTVLHSAALDVSDGDAVEAFAAEVHAAHGAVGVVMNVAGISTWGSIEQLQREHWRAQVEVNLMGPIHVLSAFVPPMIAAGRGGHVVNVASAAALFGLPWHAAYSASKFGLRGVSEVLRFDLARHGIGVSLVCPGAVKTPLVASAVIVGVDRDDPKIKKLIGRFERHAKSPEHVAACILKGVRKNKYMVYTSPDTAVGAFFQRVFPWPYERAMKQLNNYLVSVAAAE
ncbi:SDR family oxidoreductase [Baekduia sp. Peel2402]|uniref:SDR family oxidoreductase n=1 Tax=Baekduia sp. Peel2402 TaxID=3458296 RepID=UPI00403E4B18